MLQKDDFDLNKEEILRKAKQKYLDTKRNYLCCKHKYESLVGSEDSTDEKYIEEICIRMNHECDVLFTLAFIFGDLLEK